MAIDKPVNYDQPQTVNDELMIPPLVGEEVQLEPGTNEEVNVEMMEDGSALIGEPEQPPIAFDSNLAEYMDDNDLGLLSSDIRGSYDEDKSSRSDWEETYTKGSRS